MSDGPELSRRAITQLVAPLLLAACGGAPARQADKRGAPLRTKPLVGIFPAAGLSWIVELLPATLMGHGAIAAGVSRFVSDARALRFREANGGLDPRRVTELVVAQYGDRTRVYAASGAIDAGRIERAFAQAATNVDARAVDQRAPTIVRMFGEVRGTRAQVLVLDREAAALEIGALGPLRAMEGFATAKLTHAKPALAATPLDTLAAAAPAPARAFFRGPFEGPEQRGLGGLLGIATGVCVWLEPGEPGGASTLGVLVDLGVGADVDPKLREAYRGRLRAALQSYRESALGRLMGLTEGALEPRDAATALGFTLRFDFARAVDGLFDAVAGDAAEIFRLSLP